MRRERCTRLGTLFTHPLRGGLTSGRTYGAKGFVPSVLPHWARFVSRPDQGVGMHNSRLWRLCGRPT
jgi:hypothetical protein